MMRPLSRLAPLLATLLLLALPAAASAHGLVGRRDLPLPTWLFAWAATVVLIVSFVGLALLWRKPALRDAPERRLLKLPAWLAIPAGAIGIGWLILVIAAGLSGTQVETANLAPTAIFVLLWVGVPVASLLLGDIYAAFNPIRALGRGVGWIVKRVGGDAVPAPLEYPEKFGRWPAAVGLLAFAWVELAFPGRSDPSQLTVVVLLFVFFHLIGMSLYGAEKWVDRADPFAVWFSWVASLAPLRWENGELFLRAPISGAAKRKPVVGDVGVIVAAIGSTMWDGLSGGDVFGATISEFAADLAPSIGNNTSLALVGTLGLLLTSAVVYGLIWAGVRGMVPASARRAAAERAAATATDAGTPPAKPSGPPSTQTLLRDFAPSLVPIGVAYAVGHYLSLLAFQGQAIAPLLANPFGDQLAPGDGGWLGTAQWTIDYGWLPANTIWYLQVAALIIGHVASLVLSHDRALERFPRRYAARSQRAMLAVAVVFTCMGLWLLSAV